MRLANTAALLTLCGCAEPPDAPTPLIQADVFSAHVSGALSAGLPEPLLPRDTLAAVLIHGENGCPAGARERLNYNAAFGGCEASSGWVYAGITEYSGEPPAGRPPGEPFHLLADGYIIDPDGVWFVLGGELELGKLGDDGWFTEVTGTWSYPPAGGWMQREVSVALWAEGAPSGAVRLEGGLDDGLGDVLYFDALERLDDELSGAVEVRAEDGTWSRLNFDAAEGSCGLLDEAEALCVDGLVAALDGLTPPEGE